MEVIVRPFKKSFAFGLFIFTPVLIMAQLRVGFVQSDRIRAEYEEFKEAESELQLEFRKVQFEFQTMAERLDSLKQAFETQRLMSSPDRRREKENEIGIFEFIKLIEYFFFCYSVESGLILIFNLFCN